MKQLILLALFVISSLTMQAQNRAIEPVTWNLDQLQVESIMLGRPGWRIERIIEPTPDSPTKIIMYLSESEKITRSFGFNDGKLTTSFLSFYTDPELPAGESETYADSRFKKTAENRWLDPATHTHIARTYDGPWVRYKMTNEQWGRELMKSSRN